MYVPSSRMQTNLISLSVSSFLDKENTEYIGMKHSVADAFEFQRLCGWIKEYDFSLRFSLNLTRAFERYSPEQLFGYCKDLGADQVTLRILYSSNKNTPQDKWIEEHAASREWLNSVMLYVMDKGTVLGALPYGKKKYSVNSMSVVLDNDCMAKARNEEEVSENYKYLILQPNCKLYSQCDDEASLIF